MLATLKNYHKPTLDLNQNYSKLNRGNKIHKRRRTDIKKKLRETIEATLSFNDEEQQQDTET